MVCISKGNTKLDNTLNVNLPPNLTCKNSPCSKLCYARIPFLRWPSVQKAWTRNYDILKNDPDRFTESIIAQLTTKNVKYFRWHSGGEIIDQNHIEIIFKIAKKCPKIKFLIFTKKYNFDYSGKPSNLTLVFSSWPGMIIPEYILRHYRIAWMQDGTEVRMKNRRHFICPAINSNGTITCNQCRRCWNINSNRIDVVFPKH